MATLMKMTINGIRSFGPYEEHLQQLSFTLPLTLILGQNGCGKTTIIESIKYACSGELPAGSNNGQGFVNDPKMLGNCSTKGQIKLKILDVEGNQVTVSRIMEVVQSGAGLKFSTKNATIRVVDRDGNDRSASRRCLDITTECCQVMNVSPAVLNNVIFCHQENSSWPLDEGKKLKEKFDDIFDAQKYNRCTEALRKVLKGEQEKIKRLVIHLDYALKRKDYVEKQKNSLEVKEDKKRSFEDDIQTKTQQMDPIKKRIEKIQQLEIELGDLRNELTSKEATRKGLIEEQASIKKSMAFEFEGSDEELQQKISSFEKDRENDEHIIAELEKRKIDIENRSKAIYKAIQEAQNQVGQLNQQKAQHQEKCVERKELLEKAKNQMDVKTSSDCSNHENAKNTLHELKDVLDSCELELHALIQDKEVQESDLQKAIDEARANNLRTKHNVESKSKLVKEYEQKIDRISNELDALSAAEQHLNTFETKIVEIEKRIIKLNMSFKESEESQKTETYKRQIEEMERNLEKLEAQHRTLQQNDVTEGKLEAEKQSIMEKQRIVTNIKTKHFENLKQLFEGSVPEKNLKVGVLSTQAKADLAVKKLTEKINNKQKDVTTLEVQRQNHAEKMKGLTKELNAKQEKISQACNGCDFNEALENSYQKKEKLQLDKGQYLSIKLIFAQYIKEFEKEVPCCPICETNFGRQNGSGAVKKIITSLKSKLESVPQKLITVEKELEAEEAIYSNLQQLKLVNSDIENLTYDVLPNLKHDLEELDENLKTVKAELNSLKKEINEPQKIVDICRHIISDVASLDQNLLDLEKSKRNVETLEKELVQVESNKSKHEIEAEIDYLKSEIVESRRKVDAQVKRISNHKDRLHQMTQEKSALAEKQVKLKDDIQGRPTLERQKRELSEKVADLKNGIMESNAVLSSMQVELQNAIENKENIVAKNKREIQTQRNKLAVHTGMVQDIVKLQKEIDNYLKEEIDNKLTLIKDRLNECKSKEEKLEKTKVEIVEAISDKKEMLAKQELNFQTFRNNVILREKKVCEKNLETEINNLKKRIGGYNYKTVYEEKRRLILESETLEKQINSLQGEKNQLLITINELRQELAEPENKKAYTNYLSKYYELTIVKAVVDDLSKYIVSFEKAIVDFHKTKMTEINRHIRELWRNIYRGNDIDHIEIKTDHGAANAKKRTYNYKVVQIKKGVELDMRGRCSAGQRVLACLIIRMALAETLSSTCGILALDEPTTNLDRENIASLCDTLTRIVNSRQREKNFQLVIITHDEEFVSGMTRVQGVSHYYRVERDHDGFSVIKKERTL